MKIKVNGKEGFFDKKILLSDAIAEIGFSISLYCSGRGECGRCAVFAKGELSEITDKEKELPFGMRLACKTYALGDCEITFSQEKELPVLYFGKLPSCEIKEGSCIAVDVGTTTVCAALFENGEQIAYKTAANPQTRFGADVISRVEKCKKDELVSLIRQIVKELYEKKLPDNIVICGNTAMMYSLTNEDMTPLLAIPFEIKEHFGREVDLNLPKNAYIPQLISAFVGADALCGALICKLLSGEDDFLLADLGTNCEVMYKKGDKLYCTSAAAGSAFGEIGTPTKLIKALFHLKQSAAIDKNGRLDESNDLVYGQKAEIDEEGNFLTQNDIYRLLTDKAAIATAMQIICKGNFPSKIYISGGIGDEHLENAMKGIGLLPKEKSVTFLKNSALMGAMLIGNHEKYKNMATELYNNAELVTLTEREDFSKLLIKNMSL